MKLTKSEYKKIVSKLDKIPPCPLCSSSKRHVSDTLFEIRESQRDGSTTGDNSEVVVFSLVTCLNCGNTQFINPKFMGIDIG